MKTKTILTLISLLFAVNARASGIPTVDAAAIAQALQQFQQLQMMYQNGVGQLNQLQSIYGTFTGVRGMSLSNFTNQLTQFIPANYRSILDTVRRTGVKALSTEGYNVYQRLELGKSCESLAADAKALCEKDKAFFAEYQAMGEKAQEKMTEDLQVIQALSNKIDSATDPKAIADLSASISAHKASFDARKAVLEGQTKAMEKQLEVIREQTEEEERKRAVQKLSPDELQAALTFRKIGEKIMAGYFEDFGESFRDGMSNFATSVSSSLTDQLIPLITTALTIYFLVKGYLVMSGRAEGSASEILIKGFKIVLVAFFGLNAANFATYVIPAVYGFENMLLDSVAQGVGAGSGTNAWQSIDDIWDAFVRGFNNVGDLIGLFGWRNIGAVFGCVFLVFSMGIMAVYFTFCAVGILLMNEVFLIINFAFGPLFICMLMFATTRGWFDTWLKSTINYAFTLVLLACVLYLMTFAFNGTLYKLSDAAELVREHKVITHIYVPLMNFAVLSIATAAIVKMVPACSSALTGGASLAAIGLGQMLTGAAGGVTAIAGGVGTATRGFNKAAGATTLGFGVGADSEKAKEVGQKMLSPEISSRGSTAAGFMVGSLAGKGWKSAAERVNNFRKKYSTVEDSGNNNKK